MEHEKDQLKGYSPNWEAWLRFKKNKPALIGLGVIFFAGVIAVLGYLISPDQTPNVNEQIPEVSLKAPGFEITLLAVRKNRTVPKRNLLAKMFYGQENPYKFIPINNFEIKEDILSYEKYEGEAIDTGERIKGIQKQISLADIAFP
ncbi:MAG: hypothetical protein AB8F74_20145, partial [Saprospiraceae bacterium]